MTGIVPKLTFAGLDALINAAGDGVEARISHVAFGTANGAAYAPTGGETALRSETIRVPISGGQKTGPASCQVEAILDGGASFAIREIGFMLDDGTLLAVWSSPSGPNVTFTPGFAIAFGFTLQFVGVPADVVNVAVTTPTLNFTMTQPFAQVVAEIIRLQRRAVESENARLIPQIQSTWR